MKNYTTKKSAEFSINAHGSDCLTGKSTSQRKISKRIYIKPCPFSIRCSLPVGKHYSVVSLCFFSMYSAGILFQRLSFEDNRLIYRRIKSRKSCEVIHTECNLGSKLENLTDASQARGV